ncbi:uracil phosphoribosyltransferase [Aestuariispira insulae]|uniref:Uracil phosphoribosyltransferase n=1 Tax=Aestuariispira insulae TaxID=1461337 RepID=A0A3D9HPA8_9PROT|nr:uracil phosphoribosyltransferase [Aestuariispira insulae]RED51299.1 uracil phosphoribosyltransferase [Aestuariispira insulae]
MQSHPDFPSLHIVDHPLVQHKLTIMREKDTPTSHFRQLLREIALLMGYEITRHIPLTTKKIETPLMEMEAPTLAGRKPAIISILRAGQGMVEGLRELMPGAREGHVGLYRDPETKRPHEYYVKLPEAGGRLFILCDPMMATGHSAVHAMDVLLRHGVEEHNIRFLALVAAPEGIRVFQEHHPNVHIYTASLDEKLNEKAYIVPGLGDAGDRLFGTK